jgi:hypothetical protein
MHRARLTEAPRPGVFDIRTCHPKIYGTDARFAH